MFGKKEQLTFHTEKSLLFRLMWPVSHYVITHLSVGIGFVFLRLLNRTVVIGQKNVPQCPNTILMSNHKTMIDSFLVGMCAYYPLSLLKPSLLPWNPAAEENFFRPPWLGWLAYNWKCIPVRRGRRDSKVIYWMVEALRRGPMTLFPEGTRSRSEQIGQGRAGTGFVIMETWPEVVPVYIEGMEKVLPVGSFFPRLFNTVYVNYGKPLNLTEFKNREKNKQTAQDIIDKVMEAIEALQREIQDVKEKCAL